MNVLLALDLRVHDDILYVPALYPVAFVHFASQDDPRANCLP